LQSDGKIVVVGGVPGNNDFTVPAVLRFQTSGALDKSFASNGVFVLSNSLGSYGAIAIQPDGKILAGTSGSSPTAEGDRFTATGHLDATLGSSVALSSG
jgi:hypothetical protein